MKHLGIGLFCLLFGYLLIPCLTKGQSPAQGQPPAKGQSPAQTLTPAQQAQLQKAQMEALAQAQAQAKKMTIPQLRAELEKSPNPVLYTKQVLQKRFKIDTIVIMKTRGFNSLADSLAYTGKEKKVYGPYGGQGKRFLVQILTKAPNQFYHINQIFIDTAVFRQRMADSLANSIMDRIRKGSASFEQLAMTYSMGGEGQGDLGWIARGAMLPQIEHEVMNHKKGEIFKIWSSNGLHIIRKADEPKTDAGFALMMRVFL